MNFFQVNDYVIGGKYFSSYDAFPLYLITTIQLSMIEGWSMIMYRCMVNSGNWSFLFFVVVIVVSRFVLANLILAILLHFFDKSRISFNSSENDKKKEFMSFNEIYKGTANLMLKAVNKIVPLSSEKSDKAQDSSGTP